MGWRKKLSVLLCLPTIFQVNSVSKAEDDVYCGESNLEEIEDFPDNNVQNSKLYELDRRSPFENVLMMGGVGGMCFLGGKYVNALLASKKNNEYNPNLKRNDIASPTLTRNANKGSRMRENRVNIKDKLKSDKLLLPMNLPDEFELRNNPLNYFRKEEDGSLSLKNNNNEWFSCGKISCPSLGKVIKEVKDKNIKPNKKGKLDVIYSKNSKYLIEIGRVIDREWGNNKKVLFVPASNFNAIETLHAYDGNKCFIDYLDDPTQGPDCMEKFPSTSLGLCHITNGLKKKDAQSLISDDVCELITEQNGQCELNLLQPYGIKTSNGYVSSGQLPNDFIEQKNDSKYRGIFVENAPVWYTNGYRYTSPLDGGRGISIKINDYVNRTFNFCNSPKNVSLFIDACIPLDGNPYGYIGTSKENIKAHLRRHYLMIIYLCVLYNIDLVFLSFSGSGVFGVPKELHYEVLYELHDLIEWSGVHIVLNAFDVPNFNNVPHKESFSFTEIKSEEDLQNLMSNF